MSAYKSFAVIGAGNLGLQIVQALAAHPEVSVVVFGRIGSPVRELPAGVKSAAVDYTNVAAVADAYRAHGIEVVVSTVGVEGLAGQVVLVDAAKAAGVKLFVPCEYGMPTDGVKIGPLYIKNHIQQHLKSIGLPFARYYTGMFTEFIPWVAATETNKFYIVGKGDKLVSATSMGDIAGFVAHTLTTLPVAQLANATFRIEGERATFLEISALYAGKLVVEHVDAIPSDVPLHQARTGLQIKAEEGAVNTAWIPGEGKEGSEARGSANVLWQGHKWKGIKEVLGL